ncbi:MAG: hypothetical protein COV72_00385 [Candidatus Omnitrophica bacterium CG11_big_fil_rev_8_21_14_0_20_42_13]|uniref:Uncharacterized protein n=1 Tax=Candidatus Ghiorseimicrobium undicola TaxID=1974746 RepID=A0A2H0M000_9BACT|nr:MAG: hypothetical protein COV72_00385 [Candidatus Omnitrophica bacterium CG11_big_fil_rev_8_21_14_0_20_42_13]
MGSQTKKTCWEHWNCASETRKKCPVYLNKYGDICWMAQSSMCSKKNRDFEDCWECSFFKTQCPDL